MMRLSAAASLLFLTVNLLMTACSAPLQAGSPTISVGGDTNVPALAAAERGALGRPTVVFFHAEWCHICDKARPVMAEIEEEYEDTLAVVRMDIDEPEARPAVQRYGVVATPTFVLLTADGNVLALVVG
ncbi:MAG: thioredoxin domain-containing protein, partial [Ardenticatenaceae bacterium]